MPRLSLIATAVTALLLGACPLAPVAHADVLLIERAEAARDMDLPNRGESMARVERRFGEPSVRFPPVGGDHPQRPPITRWDYPNFSVYFEHDHVVNSVLRRSFAEESGPKPVR